MRTDTNTHHVLNGLTVDSLVLARLEGENKGEGKREREREEEKQVKKSGKESSGQVGIVFIYLSTCIVSRLSDIDSKKFILYTCSNLFIGTTCLTPRFLGHNEKTKFNSDIVYQSAKIIH